MGLRDKMLDTENGVAVRDLDDGERVVVELAADGRIGGQIEPDVAESPTPAAGDVSVHVAWGRVMRDVTWLGKDRRTEQGARYNYRGVDDVLNVVGPALRKHGVAVIPVSANPVYEVITTSGNKAMNFCRTVARFQVFGPQGDSFIGEAPGEAFDSGDKSGTKAQSVAYRTFLVQALALATNRPELDPEHGTQHEISGPRTPSVAEYVAEILEERTSINRLTQIKNELFDDRAKGAAVVELADGEEIRLVDLVRRVGADRVARQKGEQGA